MMPNPTSIHNCGRARRRIAVAGFQHETNTFAPMFAPFAEFVKADAWPGLTQGEDLFGAMAGKNLPRDSWPVPTLPAMNFYLCCGAPRNPVPMSHRMRSIGYRP